MNSEKDKEEWVSDPRRFFMPLTVVSSVPSDRKITEEEEKQYKKILMSFIDGSRLDNKDK
ncbi:MAG: hypothetical protein E6Z22_03895 [Clostridiales bacterium]|uniref:Uncharacterized protein n=1 Tax=Intestinibacter bartlettii CAG:1329 TaxID=1263063 RepID=R5XN34_9FIRM|nr:hypothetical protein [Intestinibacter bartlettii]KMW26467.1 hypothetical protein HMPREF0977_00624 [Clostridium sp. 1_1_41A1FAA]MDU5919531.1 hypothetical protein [Clostridiales bacterium]CDA10106.1 unknown [Intestinibacter bartlettii CAG:1329]